MKREERKGAIGTNGEVALGIIVGGILGALLFGTVAAALIGAMLGGAAANEAATKYHERRRRARGV